jgi:hypothetical protein
LEKGGQGGGGEELEFTDPQPQPRRPDWANFRLHIGQLLTLGSILNTKVALILGYFFRGRKNY